MLGALTNAAVAYAEAVFLVNNARGAFGSVHGADSVGAREAVPGRLPPRRVGPRARAGELHLRGRRPYGRRAPPAAAAGAVGCSRGAHAASKLRRRVIFDAVVPDVSALEKALFPDGFDDDDDEALASVVEVSNY